MCVFVRIAENRTNAKSVINAISVQEKKQKVNVHMAGLSQTTEDIEEKGDCNMYSKQQEEIKTIRKRTIELELSDADVKRIAEKAGAHGMTVGKLLESFVGDLVCGTYSNGSDERDLAGQWFDRCWFGMFPEMTFLSYLIEWGGIYEVLEAWDNIDDSMESIKITQEELSSGVMKSGSGRTYTWKDLVSGDGTHSYSNREDWESEQRDYIEQEQDIIDNCQEIISEYWNEYKGYKKAYQPGALDEEMKKVIEWRKDYQRMLENGE